MADQRLLSGIDSTGVETLLRKYRGTVCYSDITVNYISFINGQQSPVQIDIPLRFSNNSDCVDFFNRITLLDKESTHEDILRKTHPTLKLAYDEYRLLLKLYDTGDK